MKIKTVAVLGAGAVGSYVIWGLSRRKDIRLGVLAEGKRAEKLKKGCTINDEVYHPEVWTPQEAKGVDLLIVSLKYGALPGAMDSIRQVTGENTTVMSLMNGVDSEKLISDEIGASHVIYSVIKVASHKEENGYCFNPETTIGIIFGEPCAPYDSERVQAIEALFADTGLHYRSTEYIMEEILSKFRLNVCNNLPQAILGAGVGCYQDSVHMKAISDGLRRELEAIAAAKGIAISKAAASSGHGSAVPPSARYSTLQDLDAGRHTEIDMFSGALVRMGRELGIPTPYNEYTYHMITFFPSFFDISRELDEEDLELLEYVKKLGKKVIIVLNKSDLENVVERSQLEKYSDYVIEISAKLDEGREELQKAAEKLLGIGGYDADSTIFANERQIACAERARKYLAMALESLDMGETLDAVTVMIDNGANALLELTGEKATEAVVDEVFSKFCVGK